MKENLWRKKLVTWSFAILSLLFGSLFLDSSVTGNTIINDQISISPLSLIGLLLLACSAVLIFYSVKEK